MAFTPRTWVDRAVEFAGRRLLIAVNGLANGFDVSRSEGTVFVPGDEIDATNLNDLETRISDEFALINSAISGFNETILWTNPSPTATFDAQTVTLSETISNFSELEIIYKITASSIQAYSSGRIPIAYNPTLSGSGSSFYGRSIMSKSGTSIVFGKGFQYATYANDTPTYNSNICIPVVIRGYR